MTYQHFDSSLPDFYDAIRNSAYDVYSVNNSLPDFQILGSHYVGSHFIRDPRDLCVSSLNYHRITDEAWYKVVRPKEYFEELAAPVIKLGLELPFPTAEISHQDWLLTLDDNTALLYEIGWRESYGHFAAMEDFDYSNGAIMTIKYEEIFNNETPVFRNLFQHYGLSETQLDAGLAAAEKHSFKNRKREGHKHAAKGTPGQWRESFSDQTLEIFGLLRPNILEKLAYE